MERPIIMIKIHSIPKFIIFLKVVMKVTKFERLTGQVLDIFLNQYYLRRDFILAYHLAT